MISVYSTTFVFVYCIVLTFIFGAAMGSFLNCAAWRIAHKESFLKGRSHCPECGHTLGFWDLIPIFSWLFLKGKCRYCKRKVSVRYLLTELAFGLLSVGCLLCYDLSLLCLRNYIFGCCLFLLSLVDLETMEIPDGCHIVMIAAWILTAPFLGMSWKEVLVQHVLSFVLYGGAILGLSLLMDKVLKRDSMGGGDIKLIAVMSLYLGLVSSLFTLILSCILGLIFAAIGKNKNEEKQFPFGPSLAAAAWIMLYAGEPLVNWYLSLF